MIKFLGLVRAWISLMSIHGSTLLLELKFWNKITTGRACGDHLIEVPVTMALYKSLGCKQWTLISCGTVRSSWLQDLLSGYISLEIFLIYCKYGNKPNNASGYFIVYWPWGPKFDWWVVGRTSKMISIRVEENTSMCLGSLLKRWTSDFSGSEKLQLVQFSCVFKDIFLGMPICHDLNSQVDLLFLSLTVFILNFILFNSFWERRKGGERRWGGWSFLKASQEFATGTTPYHCLNISSNWCNS